MSEETIVAVYDTVAHADAAVRDLEAANVPSGAISRHSSATLGASGGASATSSRGASFWNDKFGGQPSHDTAVYDRSVESGSTVVMVRAPEQHVQAVTRILELNNPIDIDERAAGYGLTGATTATSPSTATSTGTVTGAGAGTGEQVIALNEEQIVVGKRLVDRGTTRVRRFVVETPVEENVTLHSERATIERRPASSTARTSDTDFTDRVIEVRETDEEAVVGKTAHVREEVVVRKDVNDRVETVRDTVRREDVEIEKTPGSTTTSRGTTLKN